MNVDSDDLTAPILDPAQIAALRRSDGRHRRRDEQRAPEHVAPVVNAAPSSAPWLALVILGVAIVLAMIVFVVIPI